MESAATQRRITPLLAGERDAGAETVPVRDLAEDDVFATVTPGDDATLQSAVASVRDSVPAVRDASPRQRARWCGAVAADIRDREQPLADALVRESGVPIAGARAEVADAAAQFDRVADALRSLTGSYRTWTTTETAVDNSLVRAHPLGVVRCRPSERAPLATAARQVAPAVAAGNGVVVTPPETAPVAASTLAESVAAHLPGDTVGFVPGPVETATQASATTSACDAVLDAGTDTANSRFEGRIDGGTAALVFPDADLDAAATAITDDGPSAVDARLNGPTHVFAHESIQDELVDRLAARVGDWTVGDLFDPTTAVGVLRDDDAAQRLAYYVQDALKKGGSLVRGGDITGLRYEPTVLADVPADAALVVAPTPGPVVPVTPFGSAEPLPAVGPAQTVDVFTDRHSVAIDVADTVRASTIRVNGDDSDAQVGLAGERAADAIARLTHTKRVLQ